MNKKKENDQIVFCLNRVDPLQHLVAEDPLLRSAAVEHLFQLAAVEPLPLFQLVAVEAPPQGVVR